MAAIVYALLHAIPIIYGALIGSRKVWGWSIVAMIIVAIAIGKSSYILLDLIVVAVAGFVGYAMLSVYKQDENISKPEVIILPSLRITYLSGYFDETLKGTVLKLGAAAGWSDAESRWDNRLTNEAYLASYLSATCVFGVSVNANEITIRKVFRESIERIGAGCKDIELIHKMTDDWQFMHNYLDSSLLGARLAKMMIASEEERNNYPERDELALKLAANCFASMKS